MKTFINISLALFLLTFFILMSMGCQESKRESKNLNDGGKNERSLMEISKLHAAVQMYHMKYGKYPANNNSLDLDFAEQLAILPSKEDSRRQKRLFIDYKKHRFKTSNQDYHKLEAPATKIYDPYGRPYKYYINLETKEFKIWSVGKDGIDNSIDDISNNSPDGNYGQKPSR